MDTLLDEHALEIMAFLPTFEDRWVLSLVSKRWRETYRLLLRPFNDGLASRNLAFRSDVLWEDSRGPCYTTWKDSHWMPPIAISFYFQGKRIIEQFGLMSENKIDIYRGKKSLIIFRSGFADKWKLEYKTKLKTPVRWYQVIDLPNPCPNGDVFDQVPRALAAFSFENASQEELDNVLPDETWWKSIRFDPALARRLYNFPYFVRIRKEVEAYRINEEEKRRKRCEEAIQQ